MKLVIGLNYAVTGNDKSGIWLPPCVAVHSIHPMAQESRLLQEDLHRAARAGCTVTSADQKTIENILFDSEEHNPFPVLHADKAKLTEHAKKFIIRGLAQNNTADGLFEVQQYTQQLGMCKLFADFQAYNNKTPTSDLDTSWVQVDTPAEKSNRQKALIEQFKTIIKRTSQPNDAEQEQEQIDQFIQQQIDQTDSTFNKLASSDDISMYHPLNCTVKQFFHMPEQNAVISQTIFDVGNPMNGKAPPLCQFMMMTDTKLDPTTGLRTAQTKHVCLIVPEQGLKLNLVNESQDTVHRLENIASRT